MAESQTLTLGSAHGGDPRTFVDPVLPMMMMMSKFRKPVNAAARTGCPVSPWLREWKCCPSRVSACSEEAMRKAGTAHNKSSTDMENHVFIKAKSRVSPQRASQTGPES